MTSKYVPRYPRDLYLNRELSWLEFNARVLEEAEDSSQPLLERLKFLAIFSSNLDEFFEVRVSGLKQQVSARIEPQDFSPDGMNPEEQLARIAAKAHTLVDRQCAHFSESVLPALAEQEIRRLRYADLDPEDRAFVDRYFHDHVYPVLTPLAVDPGHPFPHVHNKSLNLALLIERAVGSRLQTLFAVLQVPAVIDRVVRLPRREATFRFLLLEDLVAAHVHKLFGGFRVVDQTVFRVTRNTELEINEDEAEDLLSTIEESILRRARGEAVRLEIAAEAGERFHEILAGALDVTAADVYRVRGPIDLTALSALHGLEELRHLRDEPNIPRVPGELAADRDIYELLRRRDVLLHHPFESFGPVVDFIERAAHDPAVLAIKQTLYRTSAPSPIIDALMRAAQNGKQVTALVELKARLEEQTNILWARSLEQAGVHVVYGVMGLKTHCKAALVVRREPDGIRRYVHLGTGNYNATTARIYTDLGLFTSDPAFGEDTSELFNLLTGYSQDHAWKRLTVAPVGLRERVLALIAREREHRLAGRPGRIIAKMNALVDPSVVDALYDASSAGVPIDLLVRGICVLRPGLGGVSESIRVRSIVDRFLEHTRVFYFENGGDPEVYLGSADWMPRNFYRRIEVMFPVLQPDLKARIIDEVLGTYLEDNVKTRLLGPDGTYARARPVGEGPALRSQAMFQELARRAARSKAATPQLVPTSPGVGVPPADATGGTRVAVPRRRARAGRARPKGKLPDRTD